MENTEDLIRSVLENVRRLLNAREGTSEARPDYGMPPPSEIVHAFPHAIGRVQRHIKASLEHFEPRLENVDVLHLEGKDPLSIRFQLSAQIKTAAGHTWQSFLIRYTPSGRVIVRR